MAGGELSKPYAEEKPWPEETQCIAYWDNASVPVVATLYTGEHPSIPWLAVHRQS